MKKIMCFLFMFITGSFCYAPGDNSKGAINEYRYLQERRYNGNANCKADGI